MLYSNCSWKLLLITLSQNWSEAPLSLDNDVSTVRCVMELSKNAVWSDPSTPRHYAGSTCWTCGTTSWLHWRQAATFNGAWSRRLITVHVITGERLRAPSRLQQRQQRRPRRAPERWRDDWNCRTGHWRTKLYNAGMLCVFRRKRGSVMGKSPII